MKAFRFSLEAILELRRRAQEEAALALASVRRRLAQLEKEHERQVRKIQNLRETIGKQRLAGVVAGKEKGFREALRHEEIALGELAKNVTSAGEEEAAARAALLKARMNAEALEELKVRRKEKFDREWERKEEKQLQEIADAAFSRRP